jgi:hypothetical protein
MGQMALVKAMATGEIKPILPKNPASLGAPFVANWNDYPTIDEGIFAWWALLAKIFGLFAAANVALLSAHLLAAASFFFACRILGYHRIWAMACAILFSMSPYAFERSLAHLILTFYWHIPLGILVVGWCVTGVATFRARKKLWGCVAAAVLYGIQNPYYTWLFLQFLAFAVVICLVRGHGWRRAVFPLILIGVVLATLVLMNVDTLYSRLTLGPNPLTITREYSGLELYAFKPVELFLPSVHRFAAFKNWALHAYFSQTMIPGELGFSYLGIIGIIAFLFLIGVSLVALIRGDLNRVPPHLAGIGWIFAYSVVGGINGALGLFGLFLFRCSNRYSIVILALALLFFARELSRITLGWKRIYIFLAASLMLLLGLWDQVPTPPTIGAIEKAREKVASDARLVSSIEAKLPAQAMVFQLPVCEYPEVPEIGEMSAYEHFRPYFNSRSLRFSFGSDKGRTRERWQQEVMQFGIPSFVHTLESYGFSAVLINKKAYSDRGSSLLSSLRSAGRSQILAESQDIICVLLQPVLRPGMPPEFDQNWFWREGAESDSWRWSKGDAKVIFFNSDVRSRSLRLTFGIGTIRSRSLDIYAGPKKVYSASLDPVHEPARVDLTLSLYPGKNELSFRTDRAGEPPGNGDQRKLAFNIRDFTVTE